MKYAIRTPAGTTPSATEAAALALASAYQHQNGGDRDAWVTVLHLDGSNAGMGRRVFTWAGYELCGPRDESNPMIALFRKAIRSGAKVTLIDETGVWHLNDERRAAA